MTRSPDVATLSHDARLSELAFIRRRRAELDARETQLLAAITTDPTPDPHGPRDQLAKQWTREDVACTLRISPAAAGLRMSLAGELARRFPATVLAMNRGELDLHYGRRLADATHGLPDDAARVVEKSVLGRATQQTPAQFAAAVRRAVLAADRRSSEQRHAEAVRERRVIITPRDDGTSELWALLPAAQAVAMREAIQHLADQGKEVDARAGAERSADQRRADALAALVLGTSAAPKSVVHVTVALSTLLHLDDQAGELTGHGPVPAVLARALASDPNGTWRRLLTDPAGQILDHGRTTYRPPTHLAELVIARDIHCTFPGCQRTGRRCDLDHLIAWNHGGTTSAANLHPLCPRHHHLKHETRWDIERQPDGTTQWIDPVGTVHRRPPPDHPRDRTRELAAANEPPPF